MGKMKESKTKSAKKTRALALSGGGPVAGIEIGALKAFEENGINFDVFTCDCIGSWVAAIYNSLPESTEPKWQGVKKKFEGFFVPDDIYHSFPIMRGFIMDYSEIFEKMFYKIFDPETYSHLFLPDRILEYLMELGQAFPVTNKDIFNDLLLRGFSVNPIARLMIELSYKLKKTGMSSQIKTQEGIKKLVESMINFENLYQSPSKVYINAYDLDNKDIQLFINKTDHPKYKPIDPYVMGAASTILYYIENQIMNGHKYCEGAVKDTVNFKDLLKNHPDLDEIWVIKITDYKTIKPPKNLFDAALLQIMVPFDTIAADDIKLFRHHLADYNNDHGTDIKLIEVRMKYQDVNYNWSYSNLYKGIDVGYEGTKQRLSDYFTNGA